MSDLTIKYGSPPVTVPDGDTTPSAAEGTDFGTVAQGAAAVTRTFDFGIAGTYVADVTAITVPAGFTVVPLAGDNPTTLPAEYQWSGHMFRLTLETALSGVKSGTVRISYTMEGVPQPDYTFAVTGRVAFDTNLFSVRYGSPEATVPKGDTTPSATEGTDFGTVQQGTPAVVHTFRYGMGGTWETTVHSIAAPEGFTVQPLSPDGQPTTLPEQYQWGGYFFRLTLDTSQQGIRAGTVRIVYDEDGVPQTDYTFAVTATVAVGGGQHIQRTLLGVG